MALTRSVVFVIERTDAFGECEMIANYDTRVEAENYARELRRESRAMDDRRDRVRYAVIREVWTGDAAS